MSSELDDPGYNYWHQTMLDSLQPEKFTRLIVKVWIAAVVSVVLLLLAAGNSEGSIQRLFLWAGAVWAFVIPLALAVILHTYAHLVKDSIDLDDIEGRKQRAPLAQRIRKFAVAQEPYAYLLDLMGHEPARTEGGQLYIKDVFEQWALDHREQVLDEWKRDWDEYVALKSDLDYPHARHDCYPKTGEGGEDWEHIWKRRKKVWEAAHKVSPEQVEDHRLHEDLAELGRSGTREQRKARLDAEFRKLRRELKLDEVGDD